MTRVSVVIPSRSGAVRLPRVLGALSAQTHPDTEVVVVLDGDVDGSAGVVEPWRDRLDLTVVALPENRGRAAALNAGLEAATGIVLLRCDDDLEPGPEHVARHAAHHLGPPVGVIGLCPNVFPDTPYARHYGRDHDARFRAEAAALPGGQRWRVWGANVSVTRPTWEDVGPYDLGYRGYGLEDVDWGYRLHVRGYPLVLDPALDAHHHGAASTARARAGRAFHSGAALRTFEARHGTEALDPRGHEPGLWHRAVGATGRRTGAGGIDRLAGVADRFADRLPPALAQKVFAFVVEAAAVAGRTHPGQAGSAL